MRHFSSLFVAFVLVVPIQQPFAFAVIPTDPSVRKMVDDAVKFLEEQKNRHHLLGGEALISLALHKAPLDDIWSSRSQRKINDTLKRCRDEFSPDRLKIQPNTTYSHSITLMFLCEVEADANRAQIQVLVDAIVSWQQPHGGWGYSGEEQGDTSQTQYCLMALWEAREFGIPVDPHVFADACRWLLRTQDPNGAWAYKGTDSGNHNGQRVKQASIYPSVVVAGLGSLYVCADALGFTGVSEPDPLGSVSDTILPPAIKLARVAAPDSGKAYVIEGIDSTLVTRAMRDGNRWLRANAKIPQTTSHNKNVIWNFYYLYAMERYQSFRENAESEFTPNPELSWYNRGYEYLRGQQDSSGAFLGDGSKHKLAGPAVTTAFAVLFLIRNTQTTIGKTEGTLNGNRRLDQTSGELTLRDDRWESTPLAVRFGQVLYYIEKPKISVSAEELRNKIDKWMSELESTGQTRRENSSLLRSLVTHEDHILRILAVQILGRTRDLDNVPALIYALDDPQWEVVREARQGLRFISRRIEGFGVPDKPIERKAMREYQIKWTKWYQTIRPDVFVHLAAS